MNLKPLMSLDLNNRVGQCRARAVHLGPDRPRAVLLAYGADFDVDPYTEMFFFPTDTLKLAVFTVEGELLWRRDLGPGVVPGMWFCPVFAFDLDGDGVDEIWFVNNVNTQHPLGVSGYRLERLHGVTGESMGQWPWPRWPEGTLSHTFRNFIRGGSVNGRPVLLTAQGTYRHMHLQGWDADMGHRWTYDIPADAPGARGSHQCPIVDLNQDGIDEVLWGERCISLDDGRELFCADRDVYGGHSDVINPFFDAEAGRWFVFTTRESDPKASPRVALFDDRGRRVWGAVDRGHMDMGWVATIGDQRRRVAMAIRIGTKTCGPDGRFHENPEQFVFDALTGEPIDLPFSVYRTRPADLDGDGVDELVRDRPGADADVLDRHGALLGTLEGNVALTAPLCDRPGHQVLTFRDDGVVKLWAANV